MTTNKNIIRENIEIDGNTSTFNIYMQEGSTVELPSKNKFDMNIREKSELVYKGATKAVDNLFKDSSSLENYESAKNAVHNLVNIVLDDDFALRSLLSIAEHDYYTHTHSLNVSVYSVSLGLFLGLKKRQLKELGEAALLHDLGKSKIGIEIINKNGKLTDSEFSEMKHHSEYGNELSINIGIKNQRILDGIKYHHEKMDGSGYPDGLKKKDIPFYARIIGVCDVFDALTSNRSYKDALSTFEALKLMKLEMKNHLDMEILTMMIKMFR